jgi:predicted phage tail protein
MFRVIKVYGKLAKHLGQRSFKAVVSTPAEAVRFLLANFPELRALMREGQYMVSVGRNPLELGTNPELLHYPSASFETIRIVPVVAGAGAVGRIILGVALVAIICLSLALLPWACPTAALSWRRRKPRHWRHRATFNANTKTWHIGK